MKKYCFGIDIGGTFIKGAIVDSDGKIIVKDKIPTECKLGGDRVVKNIKTLCDELLNSANMNKTDITAIGMGVPGMIDGKTGVVVISHNLGFRNFEIARKTEEIMGLPVKISNDANAAALGEMKFGYAGIYKSIIMLTLGTGVGGGIVVDGKIIEGNNGAGAELGHTVIKLDGEPCSCGRRGCLETYASATAIIRDTKRAMQAHPDSKLWQIGSPDKVDGKSAFDFYESDVYAKEVVDSYVKYLACGIVNMANIFRPDAIILGGGVCAQGDSLIKPLKEILDKEIYGGSLGPQVDLVVARLGNDAGCLGAAALVI